ncbi:hypothetical protein [Halorhabdus sp. BNX81]|uniref:hypothetical protein n=1 Tax=Halorhabdus sp. BNX81 TaxID=2980181 RepID=UPI0023DD252A|nr:hypothetical protein [Halorhabdus sp. BNX81]WEL20583.1 putative membrane protein [Halorhabdus sp. BNX81]
MTGPDGGSPADATVTGALARPSKVQYVLGLFAVFSVAVALRMGPLYRSPLPFNPDGIVYAGLVRETISTGSLPIDGLPADSVHFTAMLALWETVVGHPARYLSQPMIAIVGAVPSLVGAVFAHRLTGRFAWSLSERRLAGLLAGVLLAVDGVYLHRSMPVDEQTIGLLVVPLAALVLARSVQTANRRWYLVLGMLLLSLPPLHNLDSVVALFVLVLFVVVRRLSARNLGVGSLIAVVFLGYFVGYSWGIPAFTPATVIQSQRVSYAPGLLLAWLLLVGLVLARFARLGSRTQRLLLSGAFASFVVIAAVNAVQPVFPGMGTTPETVVLLVAPLLVPLTIAAWAVPLGDRSAPEWVALLALLGAGFAIAGMSFTAALTPEYYNTAYRVQTFLHLPIAVFTAVGTGTLLRRAAVSVSSPSWRQVLTTVMVVGVVGCMALSIPVAFGGLEYLPYKGVTTAGEFDAATFSVSSLPEWASDDHISRVSRYFTPHSSGANAAVRRVTPVFDWITGGPPPDCPTVVQSSWTTTGAQVFPQQPVVIDPSRLSTFLQVNDRIYSNSAPDPITIVRPPGPSKTC